MSKLYVVVNTDISKRELCRQGNASIAIRIFTDEKLQRAGHFWDIRVNRINGERIIYIDDKEVDRVYHEES